MNEELKIIISAVTANAQKNIQAVNGELKGLEKSGNSTSKGFGAAMGKIGKVVSIAAGVTIAAIGAIVGALTNLSESTEEYRKEQAKLNTAFLSMGSTAAQAEKSFNNLYRFLGDSSKATEAAAHLAKLTTEEKALAEWTTAC
jgi:ABC-type transporter Mla subunit MlaD